MFWGWLANLSWRRTLRQKSWICWLNWGTAGGRREGLNFRPRPRTLDYRLVSAIKVKNLEFSEFRGCKSNSSRLAIFNNHFSNVCLIYVAWTFASYLFWRCSRFVKARPWPLALVSLSAFGSTLTRVAVALGIGLTTAFGNGFVIFLPRGLDWTKETLHCRVVSTRFAVPEKRWSSLRTGCVFNTGLF